MGDDNFAGWYAAHWPQVYRSVAVALGDRDLAEEAVAEAFAKALARWPQPAQADSPAGWLFRVAVNEAKTRWRRVRLERRAVRRLAAAPARIVDPPVVDDALWIAVAGLSPRTQQLVALRYVLDLPEAEIAARLGVTRGTVASMLNKARKDLGAVLAPTYAPVPAEGDS